MKRRSQHKIQTKDFYPVESIVSKRYNTKTDNYQYFIKWEGWAEKYNTWEPISNIVGCEKLIEDFENQFKCHSFSQLNTGQTGHLSESITEKLSNYRPKENYHQGIHMFLNLLNKQMERRMNCKEPIIIETADGQKSQSAAILQSSLNGQEKKINKEKVNNNKQTVYNTLNQNETVKLQQKSSDKKLTEIESQTIKRKRGRPRVIKTDKLQKEKIIPQKFQNKPKSQKPYISKRKISISNNQIENKTIELKKKGLKVSQTQIQQSKVKIIDITIINEKLNYLVADLQNNYVPIHATKEELIRVNPYVLLKFYQQFIN